MASQSLSPPPTWTNQRAAKQGLQSAEGVVSVELSGASLHLFLSPAKTTVEALQNILNNHNRGPAEFRPIVPSLEDVFIAMIHKSETVGQVPDLPPNPSFRIPEAQ